MTTDVAVVATLAIIGAACGVVAVCALIEQRFKARRALEETGGTIIIDGGWLVGRTVARPRPRQTMHLGQSSNGSLK